MSSLTFWKGRNISGEFQYSPIFKGWIKIEDKIIEFTQRRFPIDCNWLNGNCFFYAQACKCAFNDGKIFYEVVLGHFIFFYKDKYYDWSGEIHPKVENLVEWDKFHEYDSLQKQRIIRDCIM